MTSPIGIFLVLNPCSYSFLDLFSLRQTADFKLSVSTLRVRGILPSSGDIQVQTEHLASQVRPLVKVGISQHIILNKKAAIIPLLTV